MARRAGKRKQTGGGGDVGVVPAKLRVQKPSGTDASAATGNVPTANDAVKAVATPDKDLPNADLTEKQTVKSDPTDDSPGAESDGREAKSQTRDKDASQQQTAVKRSASSSSDKDPSKDGSQRLGREFYNKSGEDLAKALLGQKIVRMVDGVRMSAMIVETEAYLGAVDKAAHSYKKQTDRNKAMFMQPGTAYVYNIYGMYCCLNISSQGDGCAVLIRSAEPKEGEDKMLQLRSGKSSSKKPLQSRDIGNGPSKLCQSLGITKAEVNQRDLTTDGSTWLERGEEIGADEMVVSKRINIAYAEDWTDKPLRFYVLSNKCVSVRDKEAEKAVQTTSHYFRS